MWKTCTGKHCGCSWIKKDARFCRLNIRGVESYEVEEGLSKLKGEKAPGLEQCAVAFIKERRKEHGSCDCSIVVL